MEKFDIISRQNSNWSSSPVWVWKHQPFKVGGKPGEIDHDAPRQLRLAIDYRQLNNSIQALAHFPNPTIEFILHKFSQAKCISTLDLTNSFFQIKLSEKCKLATGFTACNKQYIFKRLPQGLNVSSAILAECLSEIITERNLF